jgi:hypothetical protein
MTFWKRLQFYGIGFGMGLLVVYAMMGNRSCVSTNEMKMQELVYQKFELSPKAECQLNCLKKNVALLKIELRHFEVNYDLSDVHKTPCGTYYIQPKTEFKTKYPFTFIIQDCDTMSKIQDFNISSSNFTCNCTP